MHGIDITNNNLINNNKNNDNCNWFQNLSNTTIPYEIQNTLSYGTNFALPVTVKNNIPINEYITSVEYAIQNKPTNEKTLLETI